MVSINVFLRAHRTELVRCYFLDSPGIPALLHLGKKSRDLALDHGLDPHVDHGQGQEEDLGPEVMEGMKILIQETHSM